MISARDLLVNIDNQSAPNKRLANIEAQLAQQQLGDIQVSTLSSLTPEMGLIESGEFRAGNGIEPGNGFSGVRIGYPGFEYPAGSGQIWHIVGVNNDVLMVGISAADGKLYAGGGAMVVDNTGIALNGLGTLITMIATANGATAMGTIGLEVPSGFGAPSLFVKNTIATGANLLTNPGFETGDLTGWTIGFGTWAADGTHTHGGSWAAEKTGSSTNNIFYQAVAASPGLIYSETLWAYQASGGPVSINFSCSFFDGPAGTGTPLGGTATTTSVPSGVWTQVAVSARAKATAQSLRFYISQSAATNFWYDDGVLTVAQDVGQLDFTPEPTILGGPFNFQEISGVTYPPIAGYMSLYADSVIPNIRAIDSSSVKYSMQKVETNALAAWQMPAPYAYETFAAVAMGGADQVRVCVVEITRPVAVNKFTAYFGVGTNLKNFGFGFYNLAGNRLVYGVAALTGATGAISTGTASPANYILDPGCYYFAWTCDSTTPTIYTWGAGGTTVWTSIFNNNTNRIGTAANASSAGVPPSALGAITAVASQSVAYVLVE